VTARPIKNSLLADLNRKVLTISIHSYVCERCQDRNRAEYPVTDVGSTNEKFLLAAIGAGQSLATLDLYITHQRRQHNNIVSEIRRYLTTTV